VLRTEDPVTQPVPDAYFRTGAFASAGPELFASYTCLACGVRLKTWDTFAAHRRGCSGRLHATGAVFGAGLLEHLQSLGVDEPPAAMARPRVAAPVPLSLASAPPAAAPSARPPAELDPFLDAPPAALALLERWRREEEHHQRLDAA
jgi:hypothetical protein